MTAVGVKQKDLPLRVAVDARELFRPPRGFAIYLESVILTLAEAGCEVTLLTHGPLRSEYASTRLPQCVLPLRTPWDWEQRELLAWLRRERPQVYFSAVNRGMPLGRTPATACVLTQQDMIPWRFPHRYWTWRWVRHQGIAQLTSMWRADELLTMSEASRRDIRRLFPWKRVTVIPHRFFASADVPADPVGRRFIYIGGTERRKRVDVLLAAFARMKAVDPECRLTLVGGDYEVLQSQIAALGLADAVEITGYVDEGRKRALLRESVAAVLPSEYEGFGLVIAESLLAGTPVIAGRGGAQPEVGGAAALYANPRDAGALAGAMAEILRPEVRARLRAAREMQVGRLLDPGIAVRLVEFFGSAARRKNL